MYLYMYIHIHILHFRTCMHICIYTCIYIYVYIYNIYIYICVCAYVYVYLCILIHINDIWRNVTTNKTKIRQPQLLVRTQRLVGSLKLQFSFAEYRLFHRALLQKRPIILRIRLVVRTQRLGLSGGGPVLQNIVSFIGLFCKRDL